MAASTSSVDIELVAQRVIKLAEIAMLEHLEALARSQADGLLEALDDAGFACPETGFDGFVR